MTQPHSVAARRSWNARKPCNSLAIASLSLSDPSVHERFGDIQASAQLSPELCFATQAIVPLDRRDDPFDARARSARTTAMPTQMRRNGSMGGGRRSTERGAGARQPGSAAASRRYTYSTRSGRIVPPRFRRWFTSIRLGRTTTP